MALKDIFAMVKADRYTQDGREEIIKAQEEVKDVKYNIGDISQKTGLMKTANGWVEPPKGKAKGAKTGAGKSPEKQAAKESKFDYMQYMKANNNPKRSAAHIIEHGDFDEAIIDTMGDDAALEDIARDIVSPKYEAEGDIPEDVLKSAKQYAKIRYKNLEQQALRDHAPLTGDCKIRIKK